MHFLENAYAYLKAPTKNIRAILSEYSWKYSIGIFLFSNVLQFLLAASQNSFGEIISKSAFTTNFFLGFAYIFLLILILMIYLSVVFLSLKALRVSISMKDLANLSFWCSLPSILFSILSYLLFLVFGVDTVPFSFPFFLTRIVSTLAVLAPLFYFIITLKEYTQQQYPKIILAVLVFPLLVFAIVFLRLLYLAFGELLK